MTNSSTLIIKASATTDATTAPVVTTISRQETKLKNGEFTILMAAEHTPGQSNTTAK